MEQKQQILLVDANGLLSGTSELDEIQSHYIRRGANVIRIKNPAEALNRALLYYGTSSQVSLLVISHQTEEFDWKEFERILQLHAPDVKTVFLDGKDKDFLTELV